MIRAAYSNILSGKTCLFRAFNSLDTGLGAGIQHLQGGGKEEKLTQKHNQVQICFTIKRKMWNLYLVPTILPLPTRFTLPETQGFLIVGNMYKVAESFRLPVL